MDRHRIVLHTRGPLEQKSAGCLPRKRSFVRDGHSRRWEDLGRTLLQKMGFSQPEQTKGPAGATGVAGTKECQGSGGDAASQGSDAASNGSGAASKGSGGDGREPCIAAVNTIRERVLADRP